MIPYGRHSPTSRWSRGPGSGGRRPSPSRSRRGADRHRLAARPWRGHCRRAGRPRRHAAARRSPGTRCLGISSSSTSSRGTRSANRTSRRCVACSPLPITPDATASDALAGTRRTIPCGARRSPGPGLGRIGGRAIRDDLGIGCQRHRAGDRRGHARTAGPRLVATTSRQHQRNVAVALNILVDGTSAVVPAPAAAVDYARRLTQQDVPATLLSRTYRVGQARFLEVCIDELLRQTSGEHLEGLATRQMIAIASEYLDHVVEQVLTTCSESRDAWVRDRSAVLVMRIRAVLRGDRVDVPATERALDYRFDRQPSVARAVGRQTGGRRPCPLPSPRERPWRHRSATRGASCSSRAMNRRRGPSFRQATSARAVALAAGDDRAAITPLVNVARSRCCAPAFCRVVLEGRRGHRVTATAR